MYICMMTSGVQRILVFVVRVYETFNMVTVESKCGAVVCQHSEVVQASCFINSFARLQRFDNCETGNNCQVSIVNVTDENEFVFGQKHVDTMTRKDILKIEWMDKSLDELTAFTRY